MARMKRAGRDISLFRYLDRAIGFAACVMVSPIVFLHQSLSRARVDTPRRILIIKFFGLGSILRGQGLFESIRRRYPNVELQLLTFGSNVDLVRRLDLFSAVLGVDKSSLLRLVYSMFHRMAQIATRRYEVVIDMEYFSNFSTLLTFLTLAPVRVGYYQHRGFREWILNRTIPYNPMRHITEVYSALGRAIGVDSATDSSPHLGSRSEDRAQLEELFTRFQIQSSETIVLLSVASSGLCDERRWPARRFAWLCDELQSRYAAKVIFVGMASEREQVKEVKVLCRTTGHLDLTGETDLGTFLALLERAALLVANDGGPAHLADAVGTSAIVLYGPESPAHYGVRGSQKITFYAGLYCSPCLNSVNSKIAPCKGKNVCMQVLNQEDVLEAAGMLLQKADVASEHLRRWNGMNGKYGHDDWKSLSHAL